MLAIFSLILSLTIMAAPATAEEISLKQVIETVLSEHPELGVNRVDQAIATTEQARIAGKLEPVVTANLALSDEKTPTISSFQPSESRIASLSGSIAKPLSDGATVGADFTYTRTSQGFVSPFAAQLAQFNPVYRNQINLNYRRPLFRGAGRPDYTEGLINASAGIEQALKQRDIIAHNLALQAINAYYQLASDDISIAIAEQAVKRSEKLLAYQRQRETFGLIEKADRLQASALLAARKTDLQRARSLRMRHENSLNRLMLRSSSDPIRVRFGLVKDLSVPELEQAVQQSMTRRPELQELKSRLDAAESQLKIARDADQFQLDLVAKLGTRALNRTPMKTAAAGLSAHDHFASLSFEFSDTPARKTVSAAIRKAELQRERILAERANTVKQINDDIYAARTAIISGIATLALARRQVTAEQRKFNAEMKRYRQGRSDTATLVQFEGELRNASLNAKLQALTIELARQQLAWAEGTLLHNLGIAGTEPAQSTSDLIGITQ